MIGATTIRKRWRTAMAGLAFFILALASTQAQQMVTETRDPKQTQDDEFARLAKEWTGEARFGSPLVDHLPLVKGIPTPKDVLGYYIGAPNKLTYYADILKYYRALEKAAPTRVKIETIGKTDEGREMVTVYISSDANMKTLAQNTANLGKLADPRGLSDTQVEQLVENTKPEYHLMGGLQLAHRTFVGRGRAPTVAVDGFQGLMQGSAAALYLRPARSDLLAELAALAAHGVATGA